ncbi:hypothetical protein JKP88DRAFT_28428 [Tribonema minus]|uniref:F-box domain-containing protein n=1 Tax=Tribonema minus TaxID=303371 RepID=A0A835Z737_9STRA|nr:hypothetical protein JKP88DRAFT_28428 [Tribonema minus]
MNFNSLCGTRKKKEKGEGRQQQMEATAMTMGALAKLSNLELQHMFRFMEPESLLQVMCASNGLKNAVGKEDVWEVLCERSWGFTEPVGPDKATRTSSLPAAWALWARTFAGYDKAVVRRVFLWWRGMERWLETNAPEVNRAYVYIYETRIKRSLSSRR